jgi:hypothetical protein
MVLAAPAMAAKITHFNGAAADVTDQTDYLVLGKGLSGNVTVLFDDNGNSFTLDATNTTLVITYAVNISSYSYSASGDTANLTVTRNPLNLTFNYSGTSTVTISSINLTFNYSTGLSTSEGINTATANSKSVLAYVSEYINVYNATNTTEKISYIVFDPSEVYHYIANVSSADSKVSVKITDGTSELNLNLTDATTNKISLYYVVYRHNYSASLVPVYRVYYNVYLNSTYFTNIVPIPAANVTDIGLKESDGYMESIFVDNKPDYNSSFMLVCYAWDGNIKNGYKFEYIIDPIGGLQVTSDHTKNVTIILPAAITAPPTALYWWQYQIQIFGYEINLLLLIGIIVLALVVALLVYRKAKGLPLLPKGFVASTFLAYATLAFWAQITEWGSTAWTWLQENYVFVGIVALVTVIVVLVSVVHFGTKE